MGSAPGRSPNVSLHPPQHTHTPLAPGFLPSAGSASCPPLDAGPGAGCRAGAGWAQGRGPGWRLGSRHGPGSRALVALPGTRGCRVLWGGAPGQVPGAALGMPAWGVRGRRSHSLSRRRTATGSQESEPATRLPPRQSPAGARVHGLPYNNTPGGKGQCPSSVSASAPAQGGATTRWQQGRVSALARGARRVVAHTRREQAGRAVWLAKELGGGEGLDAAGMSHATGPGAKPRCSSGAPAGRSGFPCPAALPLPAGRPGRPDGRGSDTSRRRQSECRLRPAESGVGS